MTRKISTGSKRARAGLIALFACTAQLGRAVEPSDSHVPVAMTLALEGDQRDVAWYSQGTAEYYSLLLSFRAGLLSIQKFIEAIDERADAYYADAHATDARLPGPEAAKISDPIARTMPYGQGFMYSLMTDAAIRVKSHGEASLDQVVLELRRRQAQHESHGIPQWLDLVSRQIGSVQAQRMYRAMADGEIEIPNTTTFAPCLAAVRKSVRTFQLGFARASLDDERIVRDLDPQSAAAHAGLEEGDKILDVQGLSDARRDATKPLALTLRRGEARLTVSYLPRGESVESYGWVRNPNVPESACKF
jgi:predicted metalloprotease with PDZ domain